MTRLVAVVALAACASEPKPVKPHPVLGALDRMHTRIEIHAAYNAGRASWMDVGVHPLPPPRRWPVAVASNGGTR